MKILLVDDEPFQLSLSKKIINICGFKNIVTASNGNEAAQKLHNSDCDFDLILCDYHMPELDGVQFLEILNENGFSGYFIFLSGSASFQEIAKNMDEFNKHDVKLLGHLPKPLKPNAFKSLISEMDL